VIDALRVEPGQAAGLKQRATDDRLGLTNKEVGIEEARLLNERLAALQERLWAEHRQRLLVVLQAMDTGGKDGVIEHVFGGVNPQGIKVTGFKAPSPVELAHDYLWRVHPHVPGNGEIVIFNRSHYEDVLVVRVHGLVPESVWHGRYRHIREFERSLAEEGTTIVKLFLHISPTEQETRLRARLADPTKRWKFRVGDLGDRERWYDFHAAYEDAITETSTTWAPWYVVPADRKWVRNVAVGRLIVDTLEQMDPQFPPPEANLDAVLIPPVR
jgi:PPK2 family polyphosphate:nucleotide phosphotransferase